MRRPSKIGRVGRGGGPYLKRRGNGFVVRGERLGGLSKREFGLLTEDTTECLEEWSDRTWNLMGFYIAPCGCDECYYYGPEL